MTDAFRNGTTTTRLVLSALRSGEALTARDAARLASEAAGRPVHPGTVSGILSRVGDPSRCDLGHFIRKGKAGGAHVYLLAEEALPLTESQIHDLTLRSGADRYGLRRALADHPRLRRFVDPAQLPPEPPADAPAASDATEEEISAPPPARSESGAVRVLEASEPAPESPPPPRRLEVSFRLGGEDTLSLRTSPTLFWIICMALTLVVASLALLAYTVLLPLFVVAAAAAGVTGTLWLLWRRRVHARKRANETARRGRR